MVVVGILKGGGGYVGIDGEYGEEGIEFILDESEGKLFLRYEGCGYQFNGDR